MNSTARLQPIVGTPSAARLRLFRSLLRCLRTSPATAQRRKSWSHRTVALYIAPIVATTAWLYAANADGLLTSIGWQPTQGRVPRFIGRDPAGHFLYAANEQSDTVVTFRVDATSGLLAP